MGSTTGLTDAQTLELYRVALQNAGSNATISELMGELSYDQATIDEGKIWLTKARAAYDTNNKEDDETSQAYHDFSTLRGQIKDQYSKHRKKAKVVFRKDATTADLLDISGLVPKAYIKWLESVKIFYTNANDKPEILQKLARLKITAEDISAMVGQIEQLEAARSKYLLEKGESQDATNAKDQAMAEIDDWMSEFYAVATIALEDKPQLLEVLGKVVK
ncbi:hypothetical protein [Reichenbachiella sp. MSK19-1]|uniref:hypothetical protein n=1 Tax=Reichenbachiella sp. MSK19-1 TaxID=1897631 RepID=UPI000E6C9200|nr:hypothetical protein [Reichenbachiella sp. MSK19-1]RJE71574.1 hypothetical protein BGP76_05630 [Reichenbachiella sp. MSK19-1]